MKRIYLITFSSALLVVLAAFCLHVLMRDDTKQRKITIGFVYVGDTSTAYTGNFVKAQRAVEKKYAGQVKTIPKFNVTEGSEESILQELVDDGCDMIFTTSFAFGEKAKEWAGKYPKVQFCQRPVPMPTISRFIKIITHIWEQSMKEDISPVWQRA